jgi:hypothetical protein
VIPGAVTAAREALGQTWAQATRLAGAAWQIEMEPGTYLFFAVGGRAAVRVKRKILSFLSRTFIRVQQSLLMS